MIMSKKISRKQKKDDLKLGGMARVKAFADFKGCSKQTVYRAIDLGRIDYQNITGLGSLVILTAKTMDWNPQKTVSKRYWPTTLRLRHLETKKNGS